METGLTEGAASVFRQRPCVYRSSLEGSPLDNRFVVEVPGGRRLPGAGADGVPNRSTGAFFEHTVFLIKSHEVEGHICVLPDRMGSGDTAAPKGLGVIRDIVKHPLGRLDQPKRRHVPDKLSGLDRDPRAIHTSAQIQSFGWGEQTAASESQLLASDADR